MIASSLRDGDDVLDLLLNKEADVNVKSTSAHNREFGKKLFLRANLLLPFSKRRTGKRLLCASLFPILRFLDPQVLKLILSAPCRQHYISQLRRTILRRHEN